MAAYAYTIADIKSAGSRILNHDPTKKPGRGTLFFRSIRLDFDAIASKMNKTLTANDTFQLFDLAVGDIVLLVGMNVITATTGAADCDIGYTGSTVDYHLNGYITNATTMAPTTGLPTGGPTYITTADTLDLITKTSTGAGGIVEVWALIGRI